MYAIRSKMTAYQRLKVVEVRNEGVRILFRSSLNGSILVFGSIIL